MKRMISMMLLGMIGSFPAMAKELLNVSYDPTRELYQEINQEYIQFWKHNFKEELVVRQSHGGSGKQARAVIDGLAADVVTLALAYDIDALVQRGALLSPDWQNRLPNHSTPFSSTIVFLVRKGNPHQIKDWNDLVTPGIKVITPNPKTSGGARWNYLAAWGYALKKFNHDQDQAKEFIAAMYRNVPILDTGARGSTMTFIHRGIGDVFIGWENEALLAKKQFGENQFEIIIPSLTILAEPPVALVEKVVEKRGTKKEAEGYLKFLYSAKAQEIAAKHFYRPTDPTIKQKYISQFPKIPMITIRDLGGWQLMQEQHFKDGGIFDQVYRP